MRFNNSSFLGVTPVVSSPVWFVIRREPYYHKLQYSKTPKNDPMAAFLGAALGAFVVYMGLSTFGTSGADLSDLTVVVWYLLLFTFFSRGLLLTLTVSLQMGVFGFRLFFHVFLFFFFLVYPVFKRVGFKCFMFLQKDCNPKKKEQLGFQHLYPFAQLRQLGFIPEFK